MHEISKEAIKLFKKEIKDPKLLEYLKIEEHIQEQIQKLKKQQQDLIGPFNKKQFLEEQGLTKAEADAVYRDMNEEA